MSTPAASPGEHAAPTISDTTKPTDLDILKRSKCMAEESGVLINKAAENLDEADGLIEEATALSVESDRLLFESDLKLEGAGHERCLDSRRKSQVLFKKVVDAIKALKDHRSRHENSVSAAKR